MIVLAGRVLRVVGSRVTLLLMLLAGVFSAVDFLPGSAARGLLGTEATTAAVEAAERDLGLDRPLPLRFMAWLGGLVTGDMGRTVRGEPVAQLLGEALPNTVLLAGLSAVVTIPAAVLLGAWWTAHPGGLVARLLAPLSTLLISLPEFVLATMLVLTFSLTLGVLPAVTITGAAAIAGPPDLVLPVAALALPQIGWNVRVVHGALVDAGRLPHVHSARLEGLTPMRLLLRHVLPCALPTISASVATTVGVLFSGTIVVEAVFNHPGVGSLLTASVGSRDASVVSTVVALSATAILGCLLVSDLVRHRFGAG